MFPELKPRISYTHTGEFFSKLLFLTDTLKHKKRSFLHILPSYEIAKKYNSLAGDLKLDYRKLENYHDVQLLEHSQNILFYLSIDELTSLLSPKLLLQKLNLKKGKNITMEECMKTLQELGYEYGEYEKAGTYQRKGDHIQIFYPHSGKLSLSFWGDEIESLEENGNFCEEIFLSSQKAFGSEEKHTITLTEYIKEKELFFVLEGLEFHPLYEVLTQKEFSGASFDILGTSIAGRNCEDIGISSLVCDSLEDILKILKNSEYRIQIYTRHTAMMQEFLSSNTLSHIPLVSVKSHLFTSFSYKNTRYIADDIIQKIFIKRRIKKKLSADIDLLLKIRSGDYVVHIDHGIGVFQGIVKKELGTISKEYIQISYSGEDKLFVPITEVHRISKYVGKENPTLTPLSGKIWERKMQKIHENIRQIAEELLKNFAERKLRGGTQNHFDSQKIQIFQNMFPYIYTEDQQNAIDDIFQDMQSEKNMDRLLVGDVGFGKTEVAFNAAYLALLNKKQVLLISPLVVLAHEHYNKALERFRGLGLKIEVLTRLQSQRHASQVLKGLADGSVHMVIGTHRLLSDKLLCKNLGLMIVDEEHKFGVVDKEKIKNIRSDIDILSLSATPIPRSLNLALSGIRDISLLKTAPEGRRSIETYVIRQNEKIIQEAGSKEFARGGQVFFVHNRVSNIEVYKKQLSALFPNKKVIVTHGQLPGDELEDRILAFKNKKYDILLSTTVIENGIDFSNVNTIFINECQSFGISQIHQLRGRVGRSDKQGYCYLLYKKEHIDGEAAKRIQTIVDYSYLGAGFELAMKDLEIRGGGDILGIKQSGQSQEIGVSLFLKMLEEKIEDLKTFNPGVVSTPGLKSKTQIDLMIAASIPDSYFLSETDKLNFYREIEDIEDISDLEYLKTQLFSQNGESAIEEETENLFLLLETQVLARKRKIIHIKRIGVNYQIDFNQNLSLDELKAFLKDDTEVKFQVIDIHRIRASVKGFANEQLFLQYVLRVLTGKVGLQKVRLIKKKHL